MSEIMVQLGHRIRPSKGAIKLYRVLGGKKFGWQLEYPKGIPSTLGAIDIAHPTMKLAIEVDGKTHESPEQLRRDQRKDEILRRLGWSVFRVSEAGCKSL